ncbi:hypothetical protein BH10PSE18_BH10PSE18_25740 [soil metagenome]|jgi:ABC-type polysaccharide/polyol phosphate export permease
MSWKINAYLGAMLVALFVLLNFIPSEHDVAVLLGIVFLMLTLVTAVSCCAATFRSARKFLGTPRKP